MNPRKLLALALVLILAVVSTGVFAYAQTAEGEPTPSASPTVTVIPTQVIENPTGEPSVEPTTKSSVEPTAESSVEPTAESSVEPTAESSVEPTAESSVEPTAESSVEPTAESSVEPTAESSVEPTVETSVEPTTEPSVEPTVKSSVEPTMEPSVEPTTEPEPTFYDQLMSAATCQSIFELINGNTEDALNLSNEQITALKARVEGMEDDGYKTDVLETLEYLFIAAEAGDIMLYAGEYKLSMSHYQPNSAVYYMVVTSTPSVYSNQNAISSVTLNSTAVKHHGSTSGWSGGQTLSTYYPGLKNGGTDTSKTLSITPASGYYVTRVVVACCGRGSESPFRCNTWAANNAYEKAFGVSEQGTITTALPSSAFGHSSDSQTYFILISVAPIPTPLYVEYDYGEIGTLLGENFAGSVFANADTWTDDSGSNVYKPSGDGSDGGVQTNDTQFKYTYSATGSDADKAEAVKSWTHTTNTVTEEAKAAAVAVGYRFVGWQYTYYNTVTATPNSSGSYNNYTYTFGNVYGSGNVGESTALTLTTNVKLVAQWEKIPADEIEPDPAFLLVTKTFIGIDAIPSDFSISVGGSTYTANDAVSTTNEDGSIVLKWKIPVSDSATYQLKESGAQVDGYNLTATPSGILNVEGVGVSVDASRVTMTLLEEINSCSNKVFSLSNDTVFIVAAHSNVVVLSAAPLGATARAAIIIEMIKKFSGDFKHNNGETVYFYQISKYSGQTISIDGTDITLSADGSTATIGATKEWTKVKNYRYGYEAAQTDISITNSYAPKICSLSISKSVEGNIGDRSKEFAFTVTLDAGYSFDGAQYSIDGAEAQSVTATDNTFSFNLKHGQTITFSGLPVGAGLTVEEADSGYVTTVDGVNGNSKVITLAETNNTITFVNAKNITIETGVLLDSLPYILILAVVIGVGVIVFIRKRRERDD